MSGPAVHVAKTGRNGALSGKCHQTVSLQVQLWISAELGGGRAVIGLAGGSGLALAEHEPDRQADEPAAIQVACGQVLVQEHNAPQHAKRRDQKGDRQ